MTLTLPCPDCNGDGFLSTGDRHAETRTDVCLRCRGHGVIPAATGETPEASARPTAPGTALPAAAGEIEALAQRIFHADDRAPFVTWAELPERARDDYREDAEIRLAALLTPKAEGEASRGGTWVSSNLFVAAWKEYLKKPDARPDQIFAFEGGWDAALALRPDPAPGVGEAVEATAFDDHARTAVARAMDEDGGWWKSCSGCHETNEGQETGDYPYSELFHCHVGAGCSECGGLGVVWEYYSDAALAALEARTGTGWPDPQPMETAPKDRMILSTNRYGAVATIMWANVHLKDGAFVGAWDDGEREDGEHLVPYEPKCWWPLPVVTAAPPSPTSEGV